MHRRRQSKKGIAPSVDKVVRINDFIVNKYSLYNYCMFNSDIIIIYYYNNKCSYTRCPELIAHTIWPMAMDLE